MFAAPQHTQTEQGPAQSLAHSLQHPHRRNFAIHQQRPGLRNLIDLGSGSAPALENNHILDQKLLGQQQRGVLRRPRTHREQHRRPLHDDRRQPGLQRRGTRERRGRSWAREETVQVRLPREVLRDNVHDVRERVRAAETKVQRVGVEVVPESCGVEEWTQVDGWLKLHAHNNTDKALGGVLARPDR